MTVPGFRAASVPRAWLAFECAAGFVAFPVGLYFVRGHFAPWIIPTLVVTGLGALVALLLDPDFERRKLWNARGLGLGLLRIGRTFLPGAALLTALVLWLRPDLFLAFPRERFGVWRFVMLLYPLLSVYPQELLFRAFFCHRYRRLFPTDTALAAASAVTFGLAHLFFANWIAPVLTTVGGWLFARTYLRSESTLQAVAEHSLWGDFLFTVGLGWYFWGGSVTQALS